MAAAEDRSLENLIRGSEELIRDLEDGGGPPYRGRRPAGARSRADRRAGRGSNGLVRRAQRGRDGDPVHLAGRDAGARDVSSAHGQRPAADLDTVREAIESRQIVYGVDWEAVKGCILSCNEERAEVAEAVVARGKKPLPERPPVLVLEEKLLRQRQERRSRGTPCRFQGAVTLHPREEGRGAGHPRAKAERRMGTSVLGNAVAFGKERSSFPRPGRNTARKEGRSSPRATDGSSQTPTPSGWTRCSTSSATSTCVSGTSTSPGTW